MTGININLEYRQVLTDIKTRIKSAQMRASLSVNHELLNLYWHVGRSIVSLQKEHGWGAAVVEQMASDLNSEYPGIEGFSRTSLFAMRQFYSFFSNFEIIPQAVGQLPWGHIRTILGKIKEVDTALFYAEECIKNGWSRNILQLQLEQKLHLRCGNVPSNFQSILPSPQSELVQQTIKDPYIFDFLTLSKKSAEREVENQLVSNIADFLLELGKGFAFLGRQYPIEINGRSYFLDLLFYHTKLKCYVVIELKIGGFKPEYAGKINFYLSAVDDLLRSEGDQPSIGLILCKDKDKFDVEYALRDIGKPIGVSSFITNITKDIPIEVQPQLPTVGQIEEQLKNSLSNNDKI
jgi:predicted nuclease of restriction endonuclease-like (RecB) superfamily